ncbi:MAG: ABC transporter ATP-binding protein [Planctomycetota bacterium]
METERIVAAMRAVLWAREHWALVLAVDVALFAALYGAVRLAAAGLGRLADRGRLGWVFSLARLYRYALPYQMLVLLCLFTMAAYSACYMGRLALVRPLFDGVFLSQAGSDSWDVLKRLAVICLALAIPLGLLDYAQEFLQKWVMIRSMIDLRRDLCRHMLGLSLKFFHDRKAGDLISRVTNDVSVVQGAMTALFGDLVLQPMMVVVGIGIAAWYSWQLAVGMFVLLPLIVLPVYALGKKMKVSKRKTLDRLGEMTETMNQMFGGIRVVKAFRLESRMLAQFDERCREFVRRHMSLVRAKALSSGFLELAQSAGIAGLVVVGGWLVINRKFGLTGGSFAGFVLAWVAVNRELKTISKTFNILQESVAACDRVFELLDTHAEVEDVGDAVECPPIARGIEFKGVGFAYRDEPVLKDVSISIRQGEVIAIVGPTGAGKSTLLDLMARYYDPTEGAIEVDGVDLRRMARPSLLSRLAIVSQDTFLFHTTIEENIRYGRPQATMEEVRAAAQAANIDDFIVTLPEGYGSIVGERGAKLSGGQRQRIAIARAILRDPQVLLLDEATSALDSESEQAVQAALNRLMEGRTVLVIAHRLSTVQHANRILVLEKGMVVEIGTHAELLDRMGLYSKLYHLQFRETATRQYRAVDTSKISDV